jgi:hypothetical protein
LKAEKSLLGILLRFLHLARFSLFGSVDVSGGGVGQ